MYLKSVSKLEIAWKCLNQLKNSYHKGKVANIRIFTIITCTQH